LFWFCAAVGAVQAACGWLAAPLVSWLYADSRLTAPIAAGRPQDAFAHLINTVVG